MAQLLLNFGLVMNSLILTNQDIDCPVSGFQRRRLAQGTCQVWIPATVCLARLRPKLNPEA
jgi:hypothetical protein